MFAQFLDFMEQFTIRSLDDLDEAMIKVAKYNQLVDEMNERCPDKKQKQKIRENTIKKHLMLMQNNTLDELVEIGVISLRGKYDILSKMKKIGITKGHIKTDMNLIPENNFTMYYKVVNENFNNLQSNK